MICERWAEDDMAALHTANGVEKAGGTVFSITSNGSRKHHGAIDPHTRFIVWFRANDEEHIRLIDEAIAREFGDDEEEPDEPEETFVPGPNFDAALAALDRIGEGGEP